MSALKEYFLGDKPLEFRGPPEQQENIARVSHRIAPTIVGYFRHRGVGAEFRVDDLRAHIARHFPGIAPDSAGRIMRDLRGRGTIDYAVINRRQSLYRITSVRTS